MSVAERGQLGSSLASLRLLFQKDFVHQVRSAFVIVQQPMVLCRIDPGRSCLIKYESPTIFTSRNSMDDRTRDALVAMGSCTDVPYIRSRCTRVMQVYIRLLWTNVTADRRSTISSRVNAKERQGFDTELCARDF